RLDPVVQVERLAPAGRLPLERGLHELLVVLADVRADRAPALGWRLDDRDVAQARQRHVQRPRDRRRGQGEYVHLEPERTEQFLLRDAEPLLLVHHHHPQLLRAYLSRENAVRADVGLALALAEIGQDALR